MLHLRSSNGFQNIFSIDVYSARVSNTLTSTLLNSPNVQYTPNSNMSIGGGGSYYINLVEQATQKEYFGILGVTLNGVFPRSKEFFLYLDGHVDDYHLNLDATGLYDYQIYLGSTNATSPESSQIILEVNNGLILVHNDNFKNDYFQNSESGVDPLTIPTTISYNG